MRPFRVLLVLGGFLGLGLACVPDCRRGPVVDPEVCVPTSSNAVAGAPFTLSTTTYGAGPGTASCVVDLDGGTLTLVLDVTSCARGGFATVPVAYATSADCAVPALDAGTYRLGNTGESFTLERTGLFRVDGGSLSACAP